MFTIKQIKLLALPGESRRGKRQRGCPFCCPRSEEDQEGRIQPLSVFISEIMNYLSPLWRYLVMVDLLPGGLRRVSTRPHRRYAGKSAEDDPIPQPSLNAKNHPRGQSPAPAMGADGADGYESSVQPNERHNIRALG